MLEAPADCGHFGSREEYIRAWGTWCALSLAVRVVASFWQNLQIFANFLRARSRLYENEILQENNSKYAFDSIFQALQDLHPFAPLQSQNFRKKSV